MRLEVARVYRAYDPGAQRIGLYRLEVRSDWGSVLADDGLRPAPAWALWPQGRSPPRLSFTSTLVGLWLALPQVGWPKGAGSGSALEVGGRLGALVVVDLHHSPPRGFRPRGMPDELKVGANPVTALAPRRLRGLLRERPAP